MTVTASFLHGVHGELASFAATLGSQVDSAGALIGATQGHVATAQSNWVGPRATGMVGRANGYLSSVQAYPVAVTAAQTIVTRWATAAQSFAESMALHEILAAESAPLGPLIAPNPDAQAQHAAALGAIGELRAAWIQTCTAFGSSLGTAISAITHANAATFIDVNTPAAQALTAQLALFNLFGSPATIAGWWAGLTDEERLVLLMTQPATVGNLDGVPAWARDIANRTQLATDLNALEEQELDGTLNPLERRTLENIRHVWNLLTQQDGYTDKIDKVPVGGQLYIYDPDAFLGDGRIAIALGDMDTAAHVGVTVSGLTTDVPSMGVDGTQNLYDESRWASEGDSVAILQWMGYDAPSFNPLPSTTIPGAIGLSALSLGNILGVRNPGMADAGAQLLADDVRGINEMRGDDPHLTVVAHSYGSTTAAIAADQYGLEADDLILIGSPGAGNAQTAADLATGTEHTWIGSASNDLVSFLGDTNGVGIVEGVNGTSDVVGLLTGVDPGVEALGNNPSEDQFGGIRFGAENEDQGGFPSIGGHTQYYDDDSESLYNMGAIVGGEGDQIIDASGPRHQAPLLEVQSPVTLDVDVDAGVSVDVDVDAHASLGMCDVPLSPIDVPCVEVGVDVDVDVDAHLNVDVDGEIRNPIKDVSPFPDDPDASRDPADVNTHDPDR